MPRHKQKPPRRYRQLSDDDLPSMNPMRIDRGSVAGFANEDHIQQLKNWVDHNQK